MIPSLFAPPAILRARSKIAYYSILPEADIYSCKYSAEWDSCLNKFIYSFKPDHKLSVLKTFKIKEAVNQKKSAFKFYQSPG